MICSYWKTVHILKIMRKFTFEWFIENFKYYQPEADEVLQSPKFILWNTSWILQLYPKKTYKNLDFISVTLFRSAACNGPKRVTINFSISIANNYGRFLESHESEEHKSVFKINEGYGVNFSKRLVNNLIQEEKVATKKGLRVYCTMWTHQGKNDDETRIYARTRQVIKKVSFITVFENAGTLESNSDEYMPVKYFSDKKSVMYGKLHVKNASGSEQVLVEVPLEFVNPYLINCKIYLLNSFGKEIECGNVDKTTRFSENETLIIPLIFKAKDLLNDKLTYLPNDCLTLRFDCTFSTEVDSFGIEETFGNLNLTPFLREKFLKSNVSCLEEPKRVWDDLRSLYKDQIVSDVQIKTANKTFPAHRAILSARSSVFRDMLATNETVKLDCIQVDDLDDNTIDQFLLFLYTDEMGDLQWESALKLCHAAEKYNVQRLKDICTSFLKSRVDTCNIGDLLLLIDKHRDCSLSTDVNLFICRNREMFCNTEWTHFMDKNPAIAMQAMHYYLRNSRK